MSESIATCAKILAQTYICVQNAYMKTIRRLRATQLEEVIRSQGRTKRWLASRVGLSESYLGRIVNGTFPVHEEKAVRIANELGVPPLFWPSNSQMYVIRYPSRRSSPCDPPSPPPKPGPPRPPPPGNVRIPVDVPSEVTAAPERAIAYRWSLRSPEDRARTSSDAIDAKPLVWADRPEGWRLVGVVYELLGDDAVALEVWMHFASGGVRVERPPSWPI